MILVICSIAGIYNDEYHKRKENDIMTLAEIKDFLQQKASNFINDVFENDGISMHLAVIGILYQTIKNYDGYENENISVSLNHINKENLEDIIMYIEDEYLNLTLTEIMQDEDSGNSTFCSNIERVIYWKIADIVDML